MLVKGNKDLELQAYYTKRILICLKVKLYASFGIRRPPGEVIYVQTEQVHRAFISLSFLSGIQYPVFLTCVAQLSEGKNSIG